MSPQQAALARSRSSPVPSAVPKGGAARRPSPYRGILFPRPAHAAPEPPASAPDFFVDLNLDQIVAAVTAGKDEYDLAPFFHRPLGNPDEVAFRHEVMRDLERPRLMGAIKAFAGAMRTMRRDLGLVDKLYYPLQKQRLFLDAVNVYCDAMIRLTADLSALSPQSRGLSAFGAFLFGLVGSAGFTATAERAKHLAAALSEVHYTVHVNGSSVEVRRYAGEADYGAEVKATFEKFEQGEVEDYKFAFPDHLDMNHIEAAVLDQVAKLYPDVFADLEASATELRDFADPAVVAFDREIQFYVAWLDYIAPFRAAGLKFCYPKVGRESKEVYDEQGFDLALAGKLRGEPTLPVCNDFHLSGRERIIVVSGPNQGGKTTFARTFGQLHYLAALGCPVPGRRAKLFLFDRLFTHFEREENAANLHGKLEDDLIRIHDILERATPDSIVLLNEIFTSTTLRDAGVLSREIAQRILRLDMLCVWVTFLDELASLGAQTVSMVSTVVPDNPAQRTYHIIRRPADGLAYALSIAERYRLTYAALKERLEP